MAKNESAQVNPASIAVLGVGAAAIVTGTVASLTVEPEDIGKMVQQIPEQAQRAVQDYLGTNNCKNAK